MRIKDKIKRPRRPVVVYEILPPREVDVSLDSYAGTISSLLSQTHIDAINIAGGTKGWVSSGRSYDYGDTDLPLF